MNPPNFDKLNSILKNEKLKTGKEFHNERYQKDLALISICRALDLEFSSSHIFNTKSYDNQTDYYKRGLKHTLLCYIQNSNEKELYPLLKSNPNIASWAHNILIEFGHISVCEFFLEHVIRGYHSLTMTDKFTFRFQMIGNDVPEEIIESVELGKFINHKVTTLEEVSSFIEKHKKEIKNQLQTNWSAVA
jgi:hypothetical protein